MNIKEYLRNSFVFLLLIFCISCSNFDKEKFSELYHSANEIEGSIEVGINYIDHSRLLQKYSTEKRLIDTTDLTEEEGKLYNLFEEYFKTQIHSQIIWDLHTEYTFENFPNFPRSYIRYQDLAPSGNEQVLKSLVQLYDLEIEKVEVNKDYYDLTRKVDAVDRNKAINKIWSRASLIFDEIQKYYNQ